MTNTQLREELQAINTKIAHICDAERYHRIELEGLAKEKEVLLEKRKDLGEDV